MVIVTTAHPQYSVAGLRAVLEGAPDDLPVTLKLPDGTWAPLTRVVVDTFHYSAGPDELTQRSLKEVQLS